MAELLPLGAELVVETETNRTLCSKCNRPARWAERESPMRERRGQIDRFLVDPDGRRHDCNPIP